MIRQLMALFFPARELRNAQPCSRVDCAVGLHYHWGYGQRQTGPLPHTGPNDFSTGIPFYKEN